MKKLHNIYDNLADMITSKVMETIIEPDDFKIEIGEDDILDILCQYIDRNYNRLYNLSENADRAIKDTRSRFIIVDDNFDPISDDYAIYLKYRNACIDYIKKVKK